MINEVKNDAEQRMSRTIEVLMKDLTKIRTGRAHPSLLDNISVDYYGSEVPLSQVANISTQDARTLALAPWEKPMIPVIEKAIMQSDLGLNPVTNGNMIRIPLPPLTEERRKELIKLVRQEAEASKVAVRNVRRDANGTLKDLQKDKDISEDEEHRAQDVIQKSTDTFIAKIDEIISAKEKDLMEI